MAIDSNQVRTNELARELEIKTKTLLEYLPEIGVTEKQTHSSWIDVKHADRVRRHFRALAKKQITRPGAIPFHSAHPIRLNTMGWRNRWPDRQDVIIEIKRRTRKKGKGQRRPPLCQGGMPSLGKRR